MVLLSVSNIFTKDGVVGHLNIHTAFINIIPGPVNKLLLAKYNEQHCQLSTLVEREGQSKVLAGVDAQSFSKLLLQCETKLFK